MGERTRGPWSKVASRRGEFAFRAVVSLIVLGVAIMTLLGSFSSSTTESWSFYVWPTIWFLLAVQFFRLGCYTSPWGVRICNPVLTFWHPWHAIDHFELGSTREMFNPKAKAVVLVTTAGKRRTIWALATSLIFFRVNEEEQRKILNELNRRVSR